MNVSPRRSEESARDFALRSMRENIISLYLEPGSVVSEKELSTALGLSRTPVREAMVQLSKVGIIQILPQKGCEIALIDYDLVVESQLMRHLLEQGVLDLLCQRGLSEAQKAQLEENLSLQEHNLSKNLNDRLFALDEDFHQMLFQFANLQLTYQLNKTFNVHFDRVRNIAIQDATYDNLVVEDHKALYQAILKQDTPGCQILLKQHLARCQVKASALSPKFRKYVKE